MISEDFNSNNYSQANWVVLNIQIASINYPDFQWIDSGIYNLSTFSGNAAIAFIYKGGNSKSTSYA